MARSVALATAIAVALLAVSGAGGAPSETPKSGGTVVIGVPRQIEPACLNPLLSNCGNAVTYLDEVLEGAFESGPARVRPELVSHVEYAKGPPVVLTYHIRPEARWSDGVPVSARDFVFTHKVFRKYLTSDDADRAYVRSVRPLGEKTVRVVLQSSFGGWRHLFGFVLPQHALRNVNVANVWRDGIDDPRTGTPIGSGPFLVANWERGTQLTLRRNPNYWGPHPAYLDRLVVRFVGLASDPLEELEKGTIGIYQSRLDPDTEPDFLRAPGFEHVYASGQGWEHFEIRQGSGGHPALPNKLVRRALAYGVDRGALVRAIFGRFVPNMRPSDSAVFLPRSPFYRPNWKGYRYRPDRARRLLEQAGCHLGSDGIYVCAGQPLSLRFVTTTGDSRRRMAIELAESQLRRVGVEVRPLYAPRAIFFDQILPSGNWDVALFAYFYLPDPLVDIAFRCGGSANVTGYCQRLVTRDLEQADRILDPVQRARALNRADSQMARDVPVIPVWNEPTAATFRPTIRGFVPSFPSIAWDAENWWLDR